MIFYTQDIFLTHGFILTPVHMNVITHESLHQKFKQWLSNIDFWQSEINFFKKQQERNIYHLPAEEQKKIVNQLAHHERLLNKLRQIISAHSLFYADFAEKAPELPEQALCEEEFQQSEIHLKKFKSSFGKLKKALKSRLNKNAETV